MALTEILMQIEKELIDQRNQEAELLQKIAVLTTPEFAGITQRTLDSKKHEYSFEGYLTLLDRLEKLLQNGMPAYLALDSVQSGYDIDKILIIWRSEGNETESRF
ncbi:MAG: hypothetical protein HFG52_08925 [Lachnospiraceae bacterium]|nr:hypothetical protein [Lachnospiraceae bacterium]